jgi:hypothetical protein
LHCVLRLRGGGLQNSRISNSSFFIKSKEGNTIEVPTLHLSCKSLDPSDWKNHDIGGIIIYDTIESKNKTVRIKPGYCFV